MKVLKFGGSSVATSKNILKVKSIVEQSSANRVVVVSALGGVTDQLVEMSKLAAAGTHTYTLLLEQLASRHFALVRELIHLQQQDCTLRQLKVLLDELAEALLNLSRLRTLSAKLQDYILSFGERMSSLVISRVLSDVVLIDARDIIKTNNCFGLAEVNFERSNQLCREQLLRSTQRVVLAGFIASNADGDTTTLGRGGSDYSAAIVAAAIGAVCAELWTDVDGFMTADPSKVQKAHLIPRLTYTEAFDLSNFGAKVVYPPTVRPLLAANIPIWIKNTFNPESPGTCIDATEAEASSMRSMKGISSLDDVVCLTLTCGNLAAMHCRLERLSATLAQHQVTPILLSQNLAEGAIRLVLYPIDVCAARQAIDFAFETEQQQAAIGLTQSSVAIITLVGANLLDAPLVVHRLQAILASHALHLIAIEQGNSALNTLCVVHRHDLLKVLHLIHEFFFD
ncbi:MAG: aspartate kinase [Bacteroidales bacterium]